MADSDLIACLYPAGDHHSVWAASQQVVESDRNRSRHAPALLPSSSLGSSKAPAYHCSPCLRLSFSPPPKRDKGLVCGWDPSCDIVLPNLSGVSFRHAAFTFDEHDRLIYQDLGSQAGSQVIYDKAGRGRRSRFRWILGGHPVPDGQEETIIHMTPSLCFRVVVCRHDVASPLYVNKVNRFRRGTAPVEALLDEVDLGRPPTEPPSGAHSPPGEGPITLQKKLGEGGFGVVWHVWDVSTGEEHALKQPSDRAIRERRVNVHRWREEARMLGQIQHPHIVTLLGQDFIDLPRLELEYLPCGPLHAQRGLTPRECLDVLRQCLSALDDLHGRHPPIVHRDISPGNILVRQRDEDNIHVKLADFGLTKESDDLVTMCGTRRYLAPEVYGLGAYTAAVDIWSLGVVVMERLSDLPDSHAKERDWCHEIAKKLKDDFRHEPDGVKELLMSMVVMDPGRRSSAHDCFNRAQALPDPTEDCCQTPRAGFSLEEDNEGQHQIVAAPGSSRGGVSLAPGPSTATGQSQSPVFVRSGAPVPQSNISAWKRTRSLSTDEEELSAVYLDWICDPLHALGGGSDLAADLGQESSGWSDLPPSTVDKSVPRSVSRTLEPTGPGLGQATVDHHSIQQGPSIVWDDAEHMAAALLLALRETD
ncbi:kinase-like domain-containing protein [Staphylotrichum tortipilum]|uniref:EKC/KEOPS complex subunit BUD32 n=1 Tax=Staphylotrichum tortipilum TaxID=2831512 RepID=A0AAN6RPI5_9PEZI|nr:kinase-like domain-containing protein [Staphylotrichum longicolle]